ncbi:DUF305 domain-containing protein [Microbispora siamensis]|uniref:Lipoprotein n=1 Tax=Microbispora siamensis TaxID=564413 RepID=A0ABQ4GYY4_9ACTN|nr:DUF305 domain-containing protein [Microbispora siamensis]GIH66580.1 lipoprotein [Microbispora siamensis]
MKRIVVPAAVLTAAGLLSTACGSTDTGDHTVPAMTATSAMPATPAPATSPVADHNDEDVMFAQMMIPHHRQAVEMAKLAEDHAAGSQVKELAKKIEAAQDPEIRTMSGWLTSWGVQVPGGRTMPMDHGMPGMMSAKDMKKLEGLKGAAFDKAFLTMMIQHHEGAVAMAEQEQAAGVYEPAKQMAASIVSSQSAEITRMKQLLR